MAAVNDNTEIWLNNFFTLGASELYAGNAWTQQFLPGWTDNKIIGKEDRLSHREIIIPEFRSKVYFDIIISTDEENEYSKEKEKPHMENSEEELHKGDFQKKHYQLLATYSCAQPREITYYESYYIAREEVKQLVRIHERMHAFHHVNMCGVWDNFPNTSPVYLEFLAQLFTFKCVENTFLENYFRELSKRQPYIYQTWELAEKLTKEEVNELYLEIKKVRSTTRFGLNFLAVKYEQAKISYAENTANGLETFCGKGQFVRLTKEHDEFCKNDDTFDNNRIDRVLEEEIKNLW